MDTPNENKLFMMKTTRDVCDAWSAVIISIEDIATTYGRFTGNLDLIKTLAEGQNAPTTGITKAKKDARQIMAETAETMAGIVHAYATRTNNADLAEKTSLNLSDITHGPDQDAATKSRAQLGYATANLANLGTSGLTQAKLTAFEQKIVAYEKLLTAPRLAKGDNKLNNEQINALIAANMKILEEELDGLVLQLKETQPKFVAYYFNARQIIDLGGGHSAPASPPTPPVS